MNEALQKCLKVLWYEYPDLPIPFGFCVLERISGSDTFRNRAANEDFISKGVVIGYDPLELQRVAEGTYHRLVEGTEFEARLRKVIDEQRHV